MRRVCVYCGSSPGKRAEYQVAAQHLASVLVKHGLGLVYGGANVGIMGELANQVLALGGEVIGVIPQALVEKEVAHAHLTELHIVRNMHERKSLMSEASDGFIALPGGLGTLEELFEMLTWAQLGLHQKPCAVLNVAGYYEHLLAFLRHATEEQFLKPQHQALLLVDDDPERLLKAMLAYQPPIGHKWLARGD